MGEPGGLRLFLSPSGRKGEDTEKEAQLKRKVRLHKERAC